MSLKPGQIYYYVEEVGDDRHPYVVVSREELNRGKYVVAVPFTSTRYKERSQQPNSVPFKQGQFGLTKDCVAQAEQITFIEIAELDLEAGPIGTLDDGAMRDVIRAIGNVISAECEPD